MDGAQDLLFFTDLSSLTLTETATEGGNRTLVLTGEASPLAYEQVRKTMQNTLTHAH